VENQQPESARPGGRHLKVRVNDGLARQVAEYAEERELSLSDAVRVLLHESLNPPQLPEEIKVLPAVVFATLLAAEEMSAFNHRFHSDWLRRYMHDLPAATAEAARNRLQEVEVALEHSGRRYRPWDERPSGFSKYLARVR